MLIGLDGATFSILNPLMDQGVMPFLKQFMESGISANLLSTIPPITPTAWTSMVTGRSPGNHGILDFIRFESSNSRYLRLSSSINIDCESIWSIVSRYNLKATTMNFPLMTPPQPINGYIIPGWLVWRYMRFGCYPPELFDELKSLPFFNVKELAMDVDLEEGVLDECPEEEWEDWIKVHIRREKQWFQVLRYMMTNNPTELTGIIFDGVDRLQHIFWRFIHPDYLPKHLTSVESISRELCLEYFSQLDNFIAEIVTLAGPEARLFFTSDHGFSPIYETFYLNSWLEQNGYLAWSSKDESQNVSSKFIVTPTRYFDSIDLSKTTAYSITTSSNGIYIAVAGIRGEHGILPENYQNFRQELMDKLLAFTDKPGGEPIVKKIWTKEEAFAGSQMDSAPDLTLVLRDNGFISTVKSDVLMEYRENPVGTHHPEGIFIAVGPDVNKGASIECLSILDIAPILLHSLGLPIPEDLEGCIPDKVFTSDFIEKHPIKTGPPTIKPEPFPEPLVLKQDKDAEQKVFQRLKKLGYIE